MGPIDPLHDPTWASLGQKDPFRPRYLLPYLVRRACVSPQSAPVSSLSRMQPTKHIHRLPTTLLLVPAIIIVSTGPGRTILVRTCIIFSLHRRCSFGKSCALSFVLSLATKFSFSAQFASQVPSRMHSSPLLENNCRLQTAKSHNTASVEERIRLKPHTTTTTKSSNHATPSFPSDTNCPP